MSLSSDTTLTMPVQPAYSYGNGGMWGGDWGAWIILFLIFGMFGWGGFGGWNNGGANSSGLQGIATRADINEGFALHLLHKILKLLKHRVVLLADHGVKKWVHSASSFAGFSSFAASASKRAARACNSALVANSTSGVCCGALGLPVRSTRS